MSNRLEELDGLRGIAAFMVFLSHVIGLLAVSKFVDFYQNSPVRVISDGAAAVDIFFVLSGFVLSLPFIDQNKNLNYLTFVMKRVFRLYPTYWICILLTIFIKDYFNPSAMYSLSEWAKTLWIKPITGIDIIRHLPLIIKMDGDSINPIVWTLAIEMKMSLILPLFIFWIKKWHSVLSQILMLLTSIVLSYLTGKFEFLPLFVIGLVLSKHLRNFEAIKKTHFLKLFVVFTLSIILIGNRFIFSFNYTSNSQSLITALGTVLFIPLAIWGGVLNKALKHPGVDFLGKISYSLYLLHRPILNLIIIPAKAYPMTFLMVFITASLLISYLSYWFLENPLRISIRSMASNKART